MKESLQIFCDEAGHTGPRLLDPDQKYYGFASVGISNNEAWKMIQDARKAFPVQMPELKAAKLLKSKKGQQLVAQIFKEIEGKYAVNFHDKLLAICGYFFEYIFEPVIQDSPEIFYQKNLHRFVAMYCYMFFTDQRTKSEEAIRQFEEYMRTLDETRAPLLFDTAHNDPANPFSSILTFAQGYKELILADNKRLETMSADRGKWVLDLATPSLWSHLNHWGKKKKLLKVVCDESKPLKSVAHIFKGTNADYGIARAKEVLGVKEDLGWEFAEPVQFGDSRDHPALQLADIVAGTSISILANGVPNETMENVAKSIEKHSLKDSILPDFDIIDLKNREAAVNALILIELAKRAQDKRDPLSRIDEWYHFAEVSWAKGDFHRIISKL